MSLYGAISPKFINDYGSESMKRVVLFDPSEIYKRIKFDPYKRSQSIGMEQLFLQDNKSICACGCEQELTGRRTRWASDECRNFAVGVFMVIRGDSEYIRRLMWVYLVHECISCHCDPYDVETKKDILSHNGNFMFEQITVMAGIHVEHIIAVKDGGGGCWLGNYQFMCHRCHKEKTNTERLMRNKQKPLPYSKSFL